MAGPDRDPSPGTPSGNGDGNGRHGREDRLKDLKARLLAARRHEAARAGPHRGRADMSGVGVTLRVGIELVGTLAVGVGIGWLLDRWLGTEPWLLVVFFFLGAAAGVLNVYRAMAGIGLAAGYRRDGEGPDGEAPDGKE